MWGWKPAKRALEHLFAAGRGRDRRPAGLPARLRPAGARDPEARPSTRRRRPRTSSGAATRCGRSQGRGALTEAGIAEHCRFDGGAKAVRPHVDALVAEGLLERVAVDDGGPPVVVQAGAELDGAPAAPVLLCPFDNLMWDRPFLRRLFGFDHLIEVYKREHERVYGYYVLPLLHRRPLRRPRRPEGRPGRRGVLQIKRFTPEPGVRRKLDEPLERAAARLATARSASPGSSAAHRFSRR